MTDTTTDPATAPKKAADWNSLAAVIAALIGLLALGVSGYTALLQREQVRAEVWPSLQPAMTIEHGRLVVSIENKGVGPALVGGLRVYVDGQARRNRSEVFDALGLADLRDTRASTVNNIVIAAGETIEQIAFVDASAQRRLLGEYGRIARVLCYCSTLGDCWLLDERPRRPEHRRMQVEECPERGPDEFVDNELVPLGRQPDA